jgi:hypothetical protein
VRSRNHGEASKNFSFAKASGQKDGGADDNLRIRHVMATKMEATSMWVPGSPILKHFRARPSLGDPSCSCSQFPNRRLHCGIVGKAIGSAGQPQSLKMGLQDIPSAAKSPSLCSSHRAASAPQPAWERGMRRIGSRHYLRNMATHSIQKPIKHQRRGRDARLHPSCGPPGIPDGPPFSSEPPMFIDFDGSLRIFLRSRKD